MSEETEQSSEVKDEGLAQEALGATAEAETPPAEKPAAEELKVPLHTVTALRTRAQQAEVAQARAEGELAALKQVQSQQVPAPKSPLQLRAEEEEVSIGEVKMDGALYEAQKEHDQQIATQATQAEATRKLGVQQLASTNKAKAAHEDWQKVVLDGQALLSPGELVDIGAAGDDFGELAYAKCATALAQNKSETDAAPEKKLSKSEAEAKAKAEAEAKAKEKVPSQQEILKGVEGDPASIAAAQL